MSGTIADIILVLVFILISGYFVIAEMSLVSLRDSQARGLKGKGRRGRAVAKLNADPNRFLASVQVGVTLAGFLSAAFGAATLAGRLAPVFEGWGLSKDAADIMALIVITMAISYVSLVIGELTPKRLALQRSEAIALAVAPTVDRVAKLARPVIWLLSVSTNGVVRLIGGDPLAKREQISDAEIRELVSGSQTLGAEERQIVEDVFEAGDRQIREVMIPRTEVDFIPASTPAYKAARMALERPHSRYPITGTSTDDVIGFVHVRDLFNPDTSSRSVRVKDIAREVLVLPDTRQILSALTDMRREGAHLAIVADEYGGTAGLITREDVVEELVGDIRDEYDFEESETTRSLSGELEVDGLLNLDDFEDETGLPIPEGPYETVAGYIVQQIGRVPRIGDVATVDGHTLTVVQLDGKRISRVTVQATPIRLHPPSQPPDAASHPAEPPPEGGRPAGRRDRSRDDGEIEGSLAGLSEDEG
ncbi:MAG: hemolysin family protein, partial [Nocardioidaceae bacterium]